jgi:hypothetical protein
VEEHHSTERYDSRYFISRINVFEGTGRKIQIEFEIEIRTGGLVDECVAIRE